MTFMASFVMSVLFEAPFMAMEKVIMRRWPSRTTKQLRTHSRLKHGKAFVLYSPIKKLGLFYFHTLYECNFQWRLFFQLWRETSFYFNVTLITCTAWLYYGIYLMYWIKVFIMRVVLCVHFCHCPLPMLLFSQYLNKCILFSTFTSIESVG